ncbi:MAG: tRNA (adenosine(37)-N6)-threonylcarbamoyltransferase complex dimerization subunit type 1 TsaB [Bacteroidota bacterium]
MPLILNIETATQICSVGLSDNGNIIAIRETNEQRSHASRVTVFIEEVFKEAGISLNAIDAVAVSMGPGSYTGLRIGVSTAKGLCFALDKPLIAVSTLESLAWGMREIVKERIPGNNEKLIFCPMIDARRMEVYQAMFDMLMNPLTATVADIIDEHSFFELLKSHTMMFAGDGSAKCKSLFEGQANAVFMDDVQPSACFMAPLSDKHFINSNFENTALFEPFYLKDFIAGKPKVKGLGN